jgi:hypothetical protein
VKEFGMKVGVKTSKGSFDLGYKKSNDQLNKALYEKTKSKSLLVESSGNIGSMEGLGRPSCNMLGTKDELAIMEYDIEPIWKIY